MSTVVPITNMCRVRGSASSFLACVVNLTAPSHAHQSAGSPYAFYLRTPLSGDPTSTTKWVVFMEGGGWCGSDSNCYQRSLTPLGSSKSYGPQPGPTEADALFALFPEAVAVYAKYCDGGRCVMCVSRNGTYLSGVVCGKPRGLYWQPRVQHTVAYSQLDGQRGLASDRCSGASHLVPRPAAPGDDT